MQRVIQVISSVKSIGQKTLNSNLTVEDVDRWIGELLSFLSRSGLNQVSNLCNGSLNGHSR